MQMNRSAWVRIRNEDLEFLGGSAYVEPSRPAIIFFIKGVLTTLGHSGHYLLHIGCPHWGTLDTIHSIYI